MGVRTGLVSVTFRQLAVEEVVEVAAQSGLAAIEWGGDIHVPLGDLPAARKARALCEDHGLAVAAYGSYLRAGSVDREEIRTAVNTAAELGAPRIRVWAGTVGTAEAGVGDRMAVTRGLAELSDVAAGSGIEVAMESHRGTLTDEVDSTITLLLDVGAPNLTTYWQPPVDLDDGECLAQLEALMPWLSTVHVFLVAFQHQAAAVRPRIPVASGARPHRQGASRDQRAAGIRCRRLGDPAGHRCRQTPQLGADCLTAVENFLLRSGQAVESDAILAGDRVSPQSRPGG